jgi:hypothetical protein
MPKRTRDADGLTVQEAKYALYLSQGMTQAEAFRKAWPKTRAKPSSIHEHASRMANKPEIVSRVKELRKAMKAADLLSVGEWTAWMIQAAREAHDSKQFAAFFTGMAKLGVSNGAISDRGLGQSELGFSEENLLERLSGGDPDKKRLLASLLGKPSFQKPGADETKH